MGTFLLAMLIVAALFAAFDLVTKKRDSLTVWAVFIIAMVLVVERLL